MSSIELSKLHVLPLPAIALFVLAVYDLGQGDTQCDGSSLLVYIRFFSLSFATLATLRFERAFNLWLCVLRM